MPFHLPFSFSAVDAVFVGGALLALLFVSGYPTRRNLPHPPGPRPLPLLGNLFHVPQSRFALAWTKFGSRYGPLTWITVPGQNILVINSFEAGNELLDRRGSIYLTRPRWVMLRELMGQDYMTGFSGYSAGWRRQRAHLKQALSMTVIKKDYLPLLETKARWYIERWSTHPGEIGTGLNRCMGEIIIELTYGRLGDETCRDYIDRSMSIAQVVLEATQGHVVDLLPFLKYLPSWLPGMGFKRDAARWKREIDHTRRTAFETARETALSGDPNLPPSYMINKLKQLYNSSEELKDVTGREEEEAAIGHSGFSFFVAGVETTGASVESLLLAMALFPSVQEKAHAELNKIVGSDRLPTFDDQEAMPYLHAVVLETLRWHPVGTVGVPHSSLKDDVYNGYFIPKGTTVMVNAWGISRSTDYYTNPTAFEPERFLKPTPELDPRKFAFGFGRRICPGNHFAFQSVWILAASILSRYRITMTEKDAAALREDTDKFSFGVVSRPVAFNCQFVPRHEFETRRTR